MGTRHGSLNSTMRPCASILTVDIAAFDSSSPGDNPNAVDGSRRVVDRRYRHAIKTRRSEGLGTGPQTRILPWVIHVLSESGSRRRPAVGAVEGRQFVGDRPGDDRGQQLAGLVAPILLYGVLRDVNLRMPVRDDRSTTAHTLATSRTSRGTTLRIGPPQRDGGGPVAEAWEPSIGTGRQRGLEQVGD